MQRQITEYLEMDTQRERYRYTEREGLSGLSRWHFAELPKKK
jgi:hypothetical protein